MTPQESALPATSRPPAAAGLTIAELCPLPPRPSWSRPRRGICQPGLPPPHVRAPRRLSPLCLVTLMSSLLEGGWPSGQLSPWPVDAGPVLCASHCGTNAVHSQAEERLDPGRWDSSHKAGGALPVSGVPTLIAVSGRLQQLCLVWKHPGPTAVGDGHSEHRRELCGARENVFLPRCPDARPATPQK